MEQKELKIYDPKQPVFGALSNNKIYHMKIDNENYKSITNYILANMMKTPIYRKILASAPIGKTNSQELPSNINLLVLEDFSSNLSIHDLYNKLLELEYINTIKRAVETGYLSLLENNVKFITNLLNTGNVPIKYNSKDQILGIGENGTGMNFVGQNLMQLRNRFQTKKRMAEKHMKDNEANVKIFDLYIAMVILQREFAKKKNLMSYYNLYPRAIIVNAVIEAGDITSLYSQLDIKMIDKDVPNPVDPDFFNSVVKLYNMGNLPLLEKVIHKPQLLAHAIEDEMRKDYIKTVKSRKDSNIFKTFIIETIKKQGSYNDDPENLYYAMERTIPFGEFNKLRDLVVERYYKNILNPDIIAVIKNSGFEDINSPTSEKSEDEPVDTKSLRSGKTSGTDETNSSDEKDPLIEMFQNDPDKIKKKQVIETLQQIEGLASSFYNKMSLETLQDRLDRKTNIPKEKIPVLEKKQDDIEIYAMSIPVSRFIDESVNLSSLTGTKKKNPKFESTIGEINEKIQRLLPFINAKIETNNEIKEETLENLLKYNNQMLTLTSDIVNVWTVYIKPKKNVRFAVLEEKTGSSIIPDKGITPIFISPIVEENTETLKYFSPLYECKDGCVLKIENRIFSSVREYIIVSLMKNTGISYRKDGTFYRGMSEEKAYDKVRFTDKKPISLDEADQKYLQEYASSFKDLLLRFAKKGLYFKFQDPYFKDILSLTNDRYIIWNDKHDKYLGIGQGDGENIVGKILQDIRSTIKPNIVHLGNIDVEEIRKKDQFLFDWMDMRIKDMTSLVSRMLRFTNRLSSKTDSLTPEFADLVLKNIYVECRDLIIISRNVKSDVPIDIIKPIEFYLQLTYTPLQNYEQLIEQKTEEYKSKFIESDKDFAEQQQKEFKAFVQDLHNISTNAKRDDNLKQTILEKHEKDIRKIEDKYLAKRKEPNKELLRLQQEQDKEIATAKSRNATQGEIDNIIKRYRDIVQDYMKKQLEVFNNLEIHEKSLFAKKDIELMELAKKQEKELEKIQELENKPLLTREEMENMISKKRREMESQLKAFNEKNKKTKEQQKLILAEQTAFQEYILQIEKEKRQEFKKNIEYRKEICKVFWKYLYAMLYFFMREMKINNTFSMKKTMTKIQFELAKKTECVKLINDVENNCIMSALLNILFHIEKFQQDLKMKNGMSEDHVDLAGSIIINQTVKIMKKKGKDTEQEMIWENEESEEPDNIFVYEEEEEKAEFVDDYEAEENEDMLDVEQVQDMLEGILDEDEPLVEFSFGKERESLVSKQSKNNIRVKLKQIDLESRLTNNLLDSLVERLIKVMIYVKEYDMDDTIKINRINFFATLESPL